jgi:hypothetical protein
MPDEPRTESVQIVPEARRNAQLALGQIHGVLHRVVILDGEFWMPLRPNASRGELTPDDIKAAYVEVTHRIGHINAALNTGEYHETLEAVGFAGAQGDPKLKGWWGTLRAFGERTWKATRDYLARLKPTLGWAGMIVGSLSTALKKEIDKVPGAGAAAEAVKEFIELLGNTAESLNSTPERATAQTSERSTKPRENTQS